MNLFRTIPLLTITLLLVAAISQVQAQQENGASLLPDIDPQDIEIRGDFEVRFPGVSRQPILGFSPRAAVFRVDPDRMPFIESDDEIVAAIPISDLEPALKPEQQFIRFADKRQVYIRGGFGRFESPELRVITESPLRSGESIALDISQHSSAGDRDFSSFRDFSGELQWTRQSGNNRLGVGMFGTSHFNYSPLPARTNFDDNAFLHPGFQFANANPQRISRQSIGMEARWQQLEHAYRGWQSVATFKHFGNEGNLPNADTRQTEETSYHVLVNRFWDGGLPEQVFGFQAWANGGFYDTGIEDSQYWLTTAAGARYRHLFGLSHKVEAWLRFYQLYDPVNNIDLYLYPDIHYQYDGMGRISASVRVRGFVNDPSLEELDNKNRFVLQYGNEMEHERGLQIHLQSGLQISRNTKAFAGIDYMQYYNHGYFAREIDQNMPGLEQSPWYGFKYLEDATHVEWYGGVSNYIPFIRTTATLEMALNHTSADDDIIPAGEIPYVPAWRSSAHVMSKPFSWLDVSTWLDVSGKRKTIDPEITLDGFIQLGARADVRVHHNFGIYIKSLNMLNQKYEVWHNYQERPFQVYGGLTFHW